MGDTVNGNGGQNEHSQNEASDLQRLRQRLTEAETARDNYREAEKRLEQRSYELGERVKELQCLYDISRMLLGAKSQDLGAVLQQVVERIPAGWQYPEITAARVRLGDVVRQSSGFAATQWIQRREFEVAEGVDGCLEVVYLEAPPGGEESGFLEEECRLLEAIANRLLEAGRRAQAEEKVQFQATLLAAVGEAVVATDAEGRIVYWNHSAERLYGWKAEDVTGRDLIELTSPQQARAAALEIFDELEQGQRWSGEFELRRKDGSTFPAYVTDNPIMDDTGEFLGIVGIARDLTDRKEIEAQLRQAQKLEAVGRLAGGIAHDFNNMLTAIRGNTQLLEQDVVGDEMLLESVREIDGAARRAASLTRQLLAFSRQQRLRPSVLSVREAIGAMRPMLDRLLGERVELRVTSGADLARVRADKGQLNQVIMNLVINAGEAMPEGGEIHIELENAELVSARGGHPAEVPEGRYVVMSVHDSGPGVDEEIIANIFEPFFTTKEDGSGLGLSTVYGIIRQSGGHIQLANRPDGGATFSVYLSRVEESCLEDTEETAAVEPARAPSARTILVCEDAPPVRRMARRALSRQGYRVLESSNAEEALELLENGDQKIDLVLSDVIMPGMGGLALAAELRERFPEVKLLLMSGYPSRDSLQGDEGELDGPFLSKPFSFGELCAKISELLDGNGGR